MKKFYILWILTILCLAGCAQQQLIMPAIKYNKPIDVQIKNKAYLYWVEGKHHSAILLNHINDDLAPALSAYLTMKAQEPTINIYPAYGKAEQVIFITSLRDILETNQVFSAVEIITNPKKIESSYPLININFKTTKHSLDKITITFELNIIHAKSHFNRSYLVESAPNNPSIILQQTSVSERIIEKIILAITEWQALNKQGK